MCFGGLVQIRISLTAGRLLQNVHKQRIAGILSVFWCSSEKVYFISCSNIHLIVDVWFIFFTQKYPDAKSLLVVVLSNACKTTTLGNIEQPLIYIKEVPLDARRMQTLHTAESE